MVARATLRTLLRSAFFVILYCPFAAAESVGECSPPGELEPAMVTQIYDGDTLRLGDGRRIRILGINAPELGRDGAADQPYARDAMRAVETFFAGGRQAFLVFDRELQDHYGRYLAHVYRRDGANLERYLLVRGLGYQIAIPPNLALTDCLAQAEREAREARKGVWRLVPVPAANVRTGGFQRVLGKVSSVAFADVWRVELEGGFSAVIEVADQPNFGRAAVAAWVGQVAELRGWVYAAERRRLGTGAALWQMRLYTPAAIETSEPEE